MPNLKLVSALLATTVAAGVAAAPAPAATRTVSIKDNVFSPRSLKVKRNTTVRFVWRGRAAHNAVGSGKTRFRSKIQSKGSYRVKLRRKGSVRVVCTLHSGMAMRITVR